MAELITNIMFWGLVIAVFMISIGAWIFDGPTSYNSSPDRF